MPESENDISDPAEALASLKAARGAVGRSMTYPFGYDLLYGGVCALLVAGQGLPQPWAVLTVPIALGALALMVRWWKNRFSFWVDGFQPKGARWVAVVVGVLFAALTIGSLVGREKGILWLPLATGAVAFVGAVVGGRWWMAVYRRDLAETVE